MINAIIQGLFNVIAFLGNLIFMPLMLAITALFPDLSAGITHVVNWFNTQVTYVPLLLDLLMIPRAAFQFLFMWYMAKFSIFLVTRSVKAAIYVYQTFKL